VRFAADAAEAYTQNCGRIADCGIFRSEAKQIDEGSEISGSMAHIGIPTFCKAPHVFDPAEVDRDEIKSFLNGAGSGILFP
jgi:hypothetical protein